MIEKMISGVQGYQWGKTWPYCKGVVPDISWGGESVLHFDYSCII
jgi:hypothetical protein